MTVAIFDPRSDLCKVAVSGLYSSSATAITLVATDPNLIRIPAVPFIALWWDEYHFPDPADDSKAEFILVTAQPTGNTLTVTRGQQGTPATTKNNTGGLYKIARVWSKKDIDEIEARFWQLSVSVKDKGLGAIGDGVTDDAAAIQAAIDARSADGGGEVFIPEGTYLLGSGITVPSNVILRGAGKAITILYSTANITIVRMGNGSAACWNAGLRDLQIKGNNTGASQIGLLLNGTSSSFSVTFCEFRDVIITHCGGCHLKADYSWINEFYNVRIGMAASTGQALKISNVCNLLNFYGCSFCYSQFTGWALEIDGIQQTFYGCHIQDNNATSGTVLFGTSSARARRCELHQCWLESNKNGSLIRIAGTSETSIAVTGCFISNPGTAPPTYDVEILSGFNNSVQLCEFEANAGTALITLGASQTSPIIAHNKYANVTCTRIENEANGGGVFIWAFNESAYERVIWYKQPLSHVSNAVIRAGQDVAWIASSDGDSQNRWAVDTYGKVSRGPGNAAQDVHEERAAAGFLRVDPCLGAVQSLEVTSALTAEPTTKRTGMICRADRATWDPLTKGSGGSYFVWWNGAAWAALDAQ